jgi:hypothetical protein
MVDTGNIQGARHDPGGDHHGIERSVLQAVGVHGCAQPDGHRQQRQLFTEISEGFGKLFLAGNADREVQLPADAILPVEKGYRMPPRRRGHGNGKPCRSGAHDGNAFGRIGR